MTNCVQELLKIWHNDCSIIILLKRRIQKRKICYRAVQERYQYLANRRKRFSPVCRTTEFDSFSYKDICAEEFQIGCKSKSITSYFYSCAILKLPEWTKNGYGWRSWLMRSRNSRRVCPTVAPRVCKTRGHHYFPQNRIFSSPCMSRGDPPLAAHMYEWIVLIDIGIAKPLARWSRCTSVRSRLANLQIRLRYLVNSYVLCQLIRENWTIGRKIM